MPQTFRLQDLTSVSTTTTQAKEDAVDIQAYKTLTLQLRKPVAGVVSAGTATLTLQHAPTLDEDAFVDVPAAASTLDLTTTTTQVETYSNLLRYVRWSVSVSTSPLTTACQFMIDVVAREV